MPPAARNTRPRKTSDKPKITGLNLDTLEREGAPEEPYSTILGGRRYVFRDPLEEDWQDQVLVDEQNAVSMLKALLSDDDWEHFKKHRLKAWKLLALARDIQRYYSADQESEGNGDTSAG